jgi:3-hydroxymyristoyl/3-hydroxydecanoyl-(acyl carrier protein) dehydratase
MKYRKDNITMKCYEVRFLTNDELRRKLIIYAFSLEQAKILAEAYPIDDVTEVKVSVVKKNKKAIEATKNRCVVRFGGEAILLKKEIDVINHMRILCGEEPIDIGRVTMLY